MSEGSFFLNNAYIPTFHYIPSFQDIKVLLTQSIKDAKHISSDPVADWKPSVIAKWNIELERLSRLIDEALVHPTQVSLFNIVLSVLCSPGAVLGRCFVKKKEVIFDTPDHTVNAALARVLKGQEKKAIKILCSNGVAPINDKKHFVKKNCAFPRYSIAQPGSLTVFAKETGNLKGKIFKLAGLK